MLAIGPLLGILGVLIAYQLKKQNKQLPLVWRGVYCFFVSGIIVALFWTPGQGVQNIGLFIASLFFILGLVYEVKTLLDKRRV